MRAGKPSEAYLYTKHRTGPLLAVADDGLGGAVLKVLVLAGMAGFDDLIIGIVAEIDDAFRGFRL